MPGKTSKLTLWIIVVAVVAIGISFREELANVPRIRVGQLYALAPGGDRVRFFVLGDTGTGEDAQRQVAAAMEARCQADAVDGILLLGDNFYQSGVTSTDDPQWEQKILAPYGSGCLSQVPIYPVLGNHDYRSNPAAQIEYTLMNPRWHMPNRFYSVRFGRLVRLVAFDSQTAEFCFNPLFCALDFLLEATGRQDTTWTFVIAHHPLASASAKGFGHRGGLRPWLLKPIMCDRADLWLSGHAHHLEHRVDLDCRLEMFTSGGGGGDLSGVLTDDSGALFARSTHGFLELDVTETSWIGRFIDVGGNVLYETSRERVGTSGH